LEWNGMADGCCDADLMAGNVTVVVEYTYFK
jgi:hypothetical protein